MQMRKIDNETLLMTMLFDFFGDLLTEKQRDYFDLYHNENLSLSEIAAKNGISKQGVHDIVTRAEKSLAEMEQKTGVIRRWLETQAELERAEAVAQRLLRLSEDGEAESLAQELVSALVRLKG